MKKFLYKDSWLCFLELRSSVDHRKPEHLQNRDMEVSRLEEHGHKGRLFSPLQTRFMWTRLLAFMLKIKTGLARWLG